MNTYPSTVMLKSKFTFHQIPMYPKLMFKNKQASFMTNWEQKLRGVSEFAVFYQINLVRWWGRNAQWFCSFTKPTNHVKFDGHDGCNDRRVWFKHHPTFLPHPSLTHIPMLTISDIKTVVLVRGMDSEIHRIGGRPLIPQTSGHMQWPV